METHVRTWSKALAYRVLAWSSTVLFMGIVTGQWILMIGASTILHIWLTILHYWTERIWLKIKWGRIE
jgi:uncharacterized membrane protein